MSTPPAYEIYKGEQRPEINWETNDNSWVGIWGYDWGDLLGNAILSQTNEFEFEVWQNDLRADRIYEYTFDVGHQYTLESLPKTKTSSVRP